MKTIERVMRVMTHVNIGATLGMVAWLVWSGHRVVAGDWTIPHIEPAGRHAPQPSTSAPGSSSCCLAPQSPSARPALQVDGAQVLRRRHTGSAT